jgi:transposase
MFSLTSSHRYFLFTLPTDMRKSFDGLQGLIENKMHRHASGGDVYVFVNKRRDRIKLLHWEPGGFVLYYKRLEEGTLKLPDMEGDTSIVTWSELIMIIEGISIKDVKKRVRYSR